MKIDFDQIRELLSVFSQTDITELTIESGEEKITLKKEPAAAGSATINVGHAPAGTFAAAKLAPQEAVKVDAAPPVDESSNTNGLVPISSPMVGTFYRSPSPSAPSFVDIGDVVNVGQTVCIIEAMKLMNDLPSEVSGKIVKVCVENGTTVEYGQPLFMVNPKG